MIADVVKKFESRLRNINGTNIVIRLDHAFSAFSENIIGKICWEDADEFLDNPAFAPAWYNLIHTIVRSLPLFTGIPQIVQHTLTVLRIVSYIPELILVWAFPSGEMFNKFKRDLIKEGLRYGVMQRLPRCSPDVPIQYKQYTIPVPVGMSAYMMHSDPNVYPEPFKFIPERWVGDIDSAMNKNYVPFCRGSRNCLGQNSSVAGLAFTAMGLLLTYPIYRALYNLYLHPLSHFPGPRTWAASRLPFICSLIAGTIVHDIEKLHQKYGPILRIAPSEVTFASAEAWTDIFADRPGHLPFPKDPVWWAKQPGNPESLLSAPSEAHARMRKLLSYGFTARAVRAQEPMIQKYVGMLIERLTEQVEGKAAGAVIDIVPWFNFTTFDIFGDLGFGESFDCLQNSHYHPWITLLFNSVKAASFVISARFYPPIEFMLMKCIPKSLRKMQRDHYRQICDKVDRRLNWELERPDLMSHVIKYNDKGGMTLGEIQATFMILTTAGSETTATALSGTVNYLSAYPAVLATLVKEVRGSFTEASKITSDALAGLPYLNAVLSEGLRLCPPIPIMLPRLVPEGGDTVCGLWMPGGTSVSLQSWTAFRDAKSFYDTLSFHPERWLPEALEEDSPFFHDQREVVQPFSMGSRSCLGKTLAWAEMRLILARLIFAFDIEASDKPLKWKELRTFLLVEKKPIEIRLRAKNSN
ncbi:hypothetical protein B7494_g5556 [Chlorociboria aeruginascens]|nr:hypothetical protein B7494_g5556 [Chlorociboria aeruginascens]